MISDEFNNIIANLDDLQGLADFRTKIQNLEDVSGTLKTENEQLTSELKKVKAQLFLTASKKEEPEEPEKSAYSIFEEEFKKEHGGN